MKIAYLTMGYPEPDAKTNGILQKIVNQVNQWAKYGHTIKWFALSKSVQKIQNDFNIEVDICYYNYGRLGRYISSHNIFNRIIKWEPDLIYTRFGSYYPGMSSMMKRVTTIFEANTNDITEYKAILPLYQYIFHLLTRQYSLRNAAGIVCVTHEIAQLFNKQIEKLAVIGNSINLSDYPSTKAPNNDVPNLIFIGAENAPWHGVDKIVQIARACPKWQFHIIGYQYNSLLHNSPPNIKKYGFLEKKQYEELMLKADIAIAGLSLYAKGMNEACGLKVREYLAYGLPVILGHRDTDFFEGAPFILRLPNCPDNVENGLAQIQNFVNAWRNQRINKQSIQHLDSQDKEKTRLVFFEEVTRRSTH